LAGKGLLEVLLGQAPGLVLSLDLGPLAPQGLSHLAGFVCGGAVLGRLELGEAARLLCCPSFGGPQGLEFRRPFGDVGQQGPH